MGKRTCFTKEIDKLLRNKHNSLKLQNISKDEIIRQITDFNHKNLHLFNETKFSYKQMKERINNYIDPEIDPKLKRSLQLQILIFDGYCSNKQETDLRKQLNLDPKMTDQTLKNYIRTPKDKICRVIRSIYKLSILHYQSQIFQFFKTQKDKKKNNNKKKDQTQNDVNCNVSQIQMNQTKQKYQIQYFQIFRPLFSMQSLLQQYSKNQNLIKIPKLFDLQRAYRQVQKQLNKNRSKTKIDISLKKRKYEIEKKIRISFQKIYQQYLKAPARCKYQNNSARQKVKLVSNIIFNDCQGWKQMNYFLQQHSGVQTKILFQNGLNILDDQHIISSTSERCKQRSMKQPSNDEIFFQQQESQTKNKQIILTFKAIDQERSNSGDQMHLQSFIEGSQIGGFFSQL